MDGEKPKSTGVIRTIVIWVIIIGGALLIFNFVRGMRTGVKSISLDEFLSQVDAGNVKEVTFTEKNLEGVFAKPVIMGDSATEEPVERFKLTLPFDDPDLAKYLVSKDVQVRSKGRQIWLELLISSVPWIALLLLFWFMFFRRVGDQDTRALEFGKSRAKIYVDKKPSVTFVDVADAVEAKEDLSEVIDFLKRPEKFRRMGARIPKGVILVGPPGTGKTLLAKAVAGEADVPFLSISGSEFVELFVGVGAARVRDLFSQAKRLAPCIVFIDEIDAVGRTRGAGLGGGHDEREQTLNQLLVEMDGFDTSQGIVIMAATNRPDILDTALLRPGRFDRQVVLDRPDVKGREEILRLHAKRIPLADDVDFTDLARSTPGFTGADLANMVNEAALLAARNGRDSVTAQDFEEARDKVMVGATKRSIVLLPQEKEHIAFHEAGHAIVSALTPGSDPVHKVSVIPRGLALGVTMQLPEEDRHLYPKSYLEAKLAYMLGGRAAELVVYGEASTGAANDLAEATELARKMVAQWGMSERLGPVALDSLEEGVFLGKELVSRRAYSEKSAEIIDEEIERVISQAEEYAVSLLKKHRKLLEEVAGTLMERETITGEELEEIIRGFGINPSLARGE
ncbi:MAG: ATP-dependent zinc metalloprotease FtsH [candidate division WOR-3 bacterium]